MPRYVLTGAPGTGKTTVLALLDNRIQTVGEPARELIAAHREATGEVNLDQRPQDFVDKLLERSIEKFQSVSDSDVALFDRGLPDVVAYAVVSGLDPALVRQAAAEHRYESPVFIAPPWELIYTKDDMRQATFPQVEEFDEVLRTAYRDLGYDLVELPRSSSEDRAFFIADRIGLD